MGKESGERRKETVTGICGICPGGCGVNVGMVDGKIEKYYSEICLEEQVYVKDNDKSVGDFVKETVGNLGENIQIKRFVRFRLGE